MAFSQEKNRNYFDKRTVFQEQDLSVEYRTETGMVFGRPAIIQGRKRKRTQQLPLRKRSRMLWSEARDWIHCLQGGDKRFFYFRDRYALMLLGRAAGSGMSVARLRRSPYGKLLSRPLVKELLARKGGGRLSAPDLASVWPPRPLCYTMSFGIWGYDWSDERSWAQTSRAGCNLGLLLAFTNEHDTPYRELIPNHGDEPFKVSAHPYVSGKNTMAWARVDLAGDLSEALIEEVQSDWFRMVDIFRRRTANRKDAEGRAALERLDRYIEAVLAPHRETWQEAMLAAAVDFLFREVGVSSVYYHTWEGGLVMKNMRGRAKPPRSLYTALPRRFCFQRTKTAPQFMQQAMRENRINEPVEFFVLRA